MIRRYLTEIFSISYASLGLFRIGIGLLLLCDLASRILYGYDLISPHGVLPVTQALQTLEGKSILSVYLISDSSWYFVLLLGLTAISYFNYLIGYKEKFFGILSLVLLFSIQNRNPFVLHGGDILLRLFLLLSLFLPIGSYTIQSKRKLQNGRYSSVATLALFVQIGLMYFFSALHKTGPEWLSGTALFYAFKINWISNSFGQSLTDLPQTLRFLTYGTLILELSVLPLIFVNFKRTYIRWALFISLFVFHLSILFMMDIGTFPFVCLLGSFLFYPGKDSSIKSDFNLKFKNALPMVILGLAATCNIFLYIRPENSGFIKTALINSGVYQKWSMFSPSPARTNVRFDVKIDNVLIDAKMNYESHHWQKLLMQMARPNNSELAHLYTNYLCRKNSAKTVSIILYERDSVTNEDQRSHILNSVICEKLDAI